MNIKKKIRKVYDSIDTVIINTNERFEFCYQKLKQLEFSDNVQTSSILEFKSLKPTCVDCAKIAKSIQKDIHLIKALMIQAEETDKLASAHLDEVKQYCTEVFDALRSR